MSSEIKNKPAQRVCFWGIIMELHEYFRSFSVLGVLIFSSAPVLAFEKNDALLDSLKRSGVDVRVERIAQSPMPGLYQIELQGGRLIYGSPDGRYLIQGALYETLEQGVRNLTALHAESVLSSMLKKIPREETVNYPARQQKASIVVFVDNECPFCRKLHEQVPSLNKAGITVRYLAYPRQGLSSEAYKTLVSVWCSQDRQAALDRAIDGRRIRTIECDNPVKSHYELGISIGIQGTPAILLENGQLITGYQPPKTLSEAALAAVQN